MKQYNLKNFIRGWGVGDFELSIIRTKDFEFYVKHFKKGDHEPLHVHKVTEEVNVIVYGVFKLEGHLLKKYDILLVEKGEASECECLEDGAIAGVKIPSVIGDKYIVENKK